MAPDLNIVTFKLPPLLLAEVTNSTRPVASSTQPIANANALNLNSATVGSPSSNVPVPAAIMSAREQSRIPHSQNITRNVDTHTLTGSSAGGKPSPLSALHSSTSEVAVEHGISFLPADSHNNSLPFGPTATPSDTPKVTQNGNRKSGAGDKPRQSRSWAVKEEHILRMWAPFVDTHTLVWTWIAAQIGTRSASQCRGRWETITKGKGVHEVAIKLEEDVDVTMEMVGQKPPELTPEQYDELWELGLDKYRENTSWNKVANTHSKLRSKYEDPNAPKVATDACSRWTNVFMSKTTARREGVLMYGWSPAGHKHTRPQYPVTPCPDPENPEECPPALKVRCDKDAQKIYKRKSSGTSSLAAFFATPEAGEDSKTGVQKATDSLLSHLENAPQTMNDYIMQNDAGNSSESSHAQTLLYGPGNIENGNSVKAHTDFVHVDSPDPETPCDGCSNAKHTSLKKCKAGGCELVFCIKCLESGALDTHRLPVTDIKPPLPAAVSGPSINTHDSMTDAELARLLQESEASPQRIKHDRAAKAKSQAQIRQALNDFENMRPSSAGGKQSTDAEAPEKRRKFVSGGFGGGGRYVVADEADVKAKPRQKPSSAKIRRSMSLELYGDAHVTARYREGGSSSEFEEEDETVPKPVNPLKRRHKASAVSEISARSKSGSAARKSAPSTHVTDICAALSDSEDEYPAKTKHSAPRASHPSLPTPDPGFEPDDEGAASKRSTPKPKRLRLVTSSERCGIQQKPPRSPGTKVNGMTASIEGMQAGNDTQTGGQNIIRSTSETFHERTSRLACDECRQKHCKCHHTGFTSNSQPPHAYPSPAYPFTPATQNSGIEKVERDSGGCRAQAQRSMTPPTAVSRRGTGLARSSSRDLVSASQTPVSLTAALPADDSDDSDDGEHERRMELLLKDIENAKRTMEADDRMYKEHLRAERKKQQKANEEAALQQLRELQQARQEAKERNARLGLGDSWLTPMQLD